MRPETDIAEIRERFLRRCAPIGAALWLHWAYWMFGGDVRAQHPDFAKEPTIEFLSGLLRNGDVVAGRPKGLFSFEPWDLTAEESIERIRREWDALKRPPNHADVAAFTMPAARRARYRREHPKSAEELEEIRRRADKILDVLFADLEDALEVAAEDWAEMDEIARDQYVYDWHSATIGNDLVPLERKHREGLLTSGQEERYRLLKEEFRRALPALEPLELAPPREVLGQGTVPREANDPL